MKVSSQSEIIEYFAAKALAQKIKKIAVDRDGVDLLEVEVWRIKKKLKD